MYADEVHPHRTHQYKNHTRDVVTEKLQRPVQRLTLRGEREHRVRVPEPRIYPAAMRSSKRTDDSPQKKKKKPPTCTRNSQTSRFVFCLTRRRQNLRPEVLRWRAILSILCALGHQNCSPPCHICATACSTIKPLNRSCWQNPWRSVISLTYQRITSPAVALNSCAATG